MTLKSCVVAAAISPLLLVIPGGNTAQEESVESNLRARTARSKTGPRFILENPGPRHKGSFPGLKRIQKSNAAKKIQSRERKMSGQLIALATLPLSVRIARANIAARSEAVALLLGLRASARARDVRDPSPPPRPLLFFRALR